MLLRKSLEARAGTLGVSGPSMRFTYFVHRPRTHRLDHRTSRRFISRARISGDQPSVSPRSHSRTPSRRVLHRPELIDRPPRLLRRCLERGCRQQSMSLAMSSATSSAIAEGKCRQQQQVGETLASAAWWSVAKTDGKLSLRRTLAPTSQRCYESPAAPLAWSS